MHEVVICFCCILTSRFTRAPQIVSDLSQSKFSKIMKELIFGAFEANWKKGDDPNDFGNQVFRPDENLELEYVEEHLRWVSCLYLTHPTMKAGQDWVEKDLHPTMGIYSASGKNAISYEIFLCLTVDIDITMRYTFFLSKICMSPRMLSSSTASIVN